LAAHLYTATFQLIFAHPRCGRPCPAIFTNQNNLVLTLHAVMCARLYATLALSTSPATTYACVHSRPRRCEAFAWSVERVP
jgi:hypothetical protein